ncbi:20410_t:CDS:2, partial [Racocetra persica]
VYSKQVPIREALLIPLDIKKHDKEPNKYIVNSYWQAFNYHADEKVESVLECEDSSVKIDKPSQKLKVSDYGATYELTIPKDTKSGTIFSCRRYLDDRYNRFATFNF